MVVMKFSSLSYNFLNILCTKNTFFQSVNVFTRCVVIARADHVMVKRLCDPIEGGVTFEVYRFQFDVVFVSSS